MRLRSARGNSTSIARFGELSSFVVTGITKSCICESSASSSSASQAASGSDSYQNAQSCMFMIFWAYSPKYSFRSSGWQEK